MDHVFHNKNLLLNYHPVTIINNILYKHQHGTQFRQFDAYESRE